MNLRVKCHADGELLCERKVILRCRFRIPLLQRSVGFCVVACPHSDMRAAMESVHFGQAFLFMRSPMQRKYATEVAHGARQDYVLCT